MILSITPSIDGKKAVKYLGLVSEDAILGANIFRDFFASIRDIVGGRSAAYEAELARPKTSRLAKCASRLVIWAPMPLSISTMKRSAPAAAC
jgi:uncharacterized protein YbjQ (UPF0145 family)